MSLERLKKSHDVLRPNQTSLGRLEKASDLRRFEDVLFTSSQRRPLYSVLKTSYLHRLKDDQLTTSWRCWFMTSWGRLIDDVLRTPDLRRLKDIRSTSSGGRPLYDVLKTSYLNRLEDVLIASSWKRAIYDVFKTPATSSWRLYNVKWIVFFFLI